MKNQLYLFIVLCTFGLVLTNCRKKTGPDDQTVVPPPEPVLLLDTLIYYESASNGSLSEYITTFFYDTSGNLAMAIGGGDTLYKVSYRNEAISSITKYNVNGEPYLAVVSPTSLTINEDSVSFFITNRNAYGTEDTTMESYLFDGDLLVEKKIYIISPEPNRSAFFRRSFKYDQKGNLSEYNREYGGSVVESFTVTAVDDKKNPWRNMPVDLMLGSDWLQCGSGINNIISCRYNDNTEQNFKWTYNEYGYPVTLIYDEVDFVQLRFIYREK